MITVYTLALAGTNLLVAGLTGLQKRQDMYFLLDCLTAMFIGFTSLLNSLVCTKHKQQGVADKIFLLNTYQVKHGF